eukprot:517510-Hanusia_phi.AAC.1
MLHVIVSAPVVLMECHTRALYRTGRLPEYKLCQELPASFHLPVVQLGPSSGRHGFLVLSKIGLGCPVRRRG